jgi:hypothetical protein
LKITPKAQEFVQAGGFTKVVGGARPGGIGSVPLRVPGTEDHDRYTLQNLAARLSRKIQVNNREAGTGGRRVGVKGLDEIDHFFAAGDDKKFTRDAMFFERPADQPGISRIVQ